MEVLYTNTSGKQLSRSAGLIMQEAKRRGISCTVLNENTIEMKRDGMFWYVIGTRTSWMSAVGHLTAIFKHLTKQVLTHHQIPTAAYRLVRNERELDRLGELTFPLVLKPVDLDHGEGIVIGIRDLEHARSAYQRAAATGHDTVLFEELLQGDEFRILCVDYQFVGAIYRKPAYVVGDGEHTIDQLIAIKNESEDRGEGYDTPLSLITVDDLVTEYLHEQNLTLESIPPDDQEVPLRKTSNVSLGGEPHNVSETVHPDNVALFEHIAKVTQLNTIGIDVMCQDLSQPLDQQPAAGIVEINSSPGLRLHHLPHVGQPIDAAAKIVDMIEKYLAYEIPSLVTHE